MMFDGAVNTNNFVLYETLLRSPIFNSSSKECPLRGTFFVKHDYNNYHNVEQLYAMGNEIAVSTVTGDDLQVWNCGNSLNTLPKFKHSNYFRHNE